MEVFILAREACDGDAGGIGDVLEVGEEEGVVDADESLCNAVAVRPFFQ